MPRYLVERIYTIDMDTLRRLQPAPRRSATTSSRRSSGSTAMSSSTRDGTPRSFCIYGAPNEEMVVEHAKRLGDHSVGVDLRDRRRRHARRLSAHRRPGLAGTVVGGAAAHRVSDRAAWSITACLSTIRRRPSARLRGVARELRGTERATAPSPNHALPVGCGDEVLDCALDLAGLAPVVGERLVRLAAVARRASR